MCVEFMWLILTERNCFVLHIFQCYTVLYDTAFYLFIFFQVWQQLPWQRLWSYRKWNLWQWTAFMEVAVKMAQNPKMKSSILMQVSRSCAWAGGELITPAFVRGKQNQEIYPKFLCSFIFWALLCQCQTKTTAPISPVFLKLLFKKQLVKDALC